MAFHIQQLSKATLRSSSVIRAMAQSELRSSARASRKTPVVGLPGRAFSSSVARKSQTLNFEEFANIINGRPRPVEGNNYYTSKSPETAEPLWKVPKGTEQDITEAVGAGKEAFATWSELPLKERARRVESLAQALEEQKAEFSDLLRAETGKPVRGSVRR